MKWAGWILVAWMVVVATAFAQQKHPDVFLITIDTLRADHVQCYGYSRVKTPALNRLANDGIRFSQAFTPSPITNASHTTILTGLLPTHHGVTDFGVPLAADHVTMAELLHDAGYKTAAFIGSVVLDSNRLAPGLDHGFGYYDNFPEHPKTKARWGRLERRGLVVVQRAERWLEAHPKGPHFVWVHLYDPHDPYEPPAPFSRIYRDHLYDGEIAYADTALGQFLSYLDKRGWYRPALIVVVGDHGEGLGEHHEDTHGIFLYDSTMHVPLIVKLPGSGNSSKSRVVDAQVRTPDILPTLLDVLGIRNPGGLDGESLKPALEGADIVSRPAFGETDYPLRFGWAPLRSLRAEGFKLIEAPRPEFYNLQADPRELNNIYEPWNKTVQKFRGMTSEVWSQGEKTREGNAGRAPASTVAELKALGYLGPTGATDVPQPSLLPDPKDKIEEQNLIHKAMLASDDGRVEEARRELAQVIAEDPNSVVALQQLGELEYSAGQYAEAARHLKQARALSPKDSLVALRQGQALARFGDYPASREALETSLHLVPGQFEARRLLAEVDMKLEDPKGAADQLEEALVLEPGNVEVQKELAQAFIADGNFSDAVEQLENAAKSKPKDAEAYALLAKAYAGLGKKELAQKAAAQAADLRRKRRGH